MQKYQFVSQPAESGNSRLGLRAPSTVPHFGKPQYASTLPPS
jgi:hypothetical protein